MEYRKRQKRNRSRRLRHDSYAGTVFCVVMLFAAIVYLIGISSAGTWMAKTVVAPVFRTLGIGLSADKEVGQQVSSSIKTPVTETLSYNSKTIYALQMGVYSNPENAAKQSAALQDLGAGGYICKDNGKYRVLAACYPDESSLSAVRKQLADEGLECSAYTFEQNAAEWIVTADENQINAIKDVMNVLLSMTDQLYTIIYTFDSEKQEVTLGITAVSLLKKEFEEKTNSLSSVGSGQTVKKLIECCESICGVLSESISYDGEDTVVFSSKLKYMHLFVTDKICQLFRALEE